jgi:glycosyltransferase involved in cell wall biosynthesis
VVLPTFQRAHLLPTAMATVLEQTFIDLELLVVDDGSRDGTADVVGAWPDERIRYLPQARNCGVASARNRGLREARGELVAFLDSDDSWTRDKLQRQVDLLRSLPDNVGLVYCGVLDDDGQGEPALRRAEHRGRLHEVLLARNVVHGTSGVVLRRLVIPVVGPFDEALPAIEDYELWTRVARFFDVDAVVDPLVTYADPPSGLARLSKEAHHNLRGRRMYFRRHAAELSRAGLATAFLLESVRRALRDDDDARGARRDAAQALMLAPGPRAALALVRTLAPTPVRRRRAAARSQRRGR